MATNLLDTSLAEDYAAPIDVDAVQTERNSWAMMRLVELAEADCAAGRMDDAETVFARLRKTILDLFNNQFNHQVSQSFTK